MEILRYEVFESIDIETLADLFAGYPVEIRIAPGGVIEFWLDDDATAANFEQDIAQKMKATCSACLMVDCSTSAELAQPEAETSTARRGL